MTPEADRMLNPERPAESLEQKAARLNVEQGLPPDFRHSSECDCSSLARQLAAVRAEADGWAEALTNADRLFTRHLTEERAKATAVRDLHHPVTLLGMVCCDECSTQRSTGPRTYERTAYTPHPCRTIQALNGEEL